MRFLTNKVLGAAVIATSLAASAGAASAYVACNNSGQCWHVRDRFDYPAGAGVVIHEDGWVFDRAGHYHWAKDRPGRGYWDHGRWRRF